MWFLPISGKVAVCCLRGNPSPVVVVGVGFVCWGVVFGLGGFSFAGFLFWCR